MIARSLTLLMLLTSMSLAAFAQEQDTVVLVTHDSFAASEAVLEAFETETGLRLEVLRAGDAGKMVNQAILSKNNPLGDVLYGVDNTFLSRALDGEIFEPYQSSALEYVDEAFLPDDTYRVSPVDYGDVCLNYDVGYFEDHDLDLPTSLRDLTREQYESLLVVQNPATSSPGLAFLLATVGVFGTDGDYTYLEFWEDLRLNDVLVVDGWSDAYYGEFSAPGRDTGTRPLVVSYASSPPAEVYFSEDPEAGAITGAIVDADTCFRQIEYVGALAGAANPDGARLLVDFMLSEAFQEDLPLNMFVFPVREAVELPDVFAEYATIPEEPAAVDPADIEEHREEWIQAWTEVMLR